MVLGCSGHRKQIYPPNTSFLLCLLVQSESKGQVPFCPLYLTFSCCSVPRVTRVSMLLGRFIPKHAQGAGPVQTLVAGLQWFTHRLPSDGGSPRRQASLIYQKGNPEDIPINAAGRRTCRRRHKVTRCAGVRWAICFAPWSRCTQRLLAALWLTSETLCIPRTPSFSHLLSVVSTAVQPRRNTSGHGSKLQSRAVFKGWPCHLVRPLSFSYCVCKMRELSTSQSWGKIWMRKCPTQFNTW